MATKRTTANLLAMPPTIRYIILRETLLRPSLVTPQSRRHASNATTSRTPPDNQPPVLSFCPGPSNDPQPRALAAPPPSSTTLSSVNTLFTSKGQKLLWTAPRFFDIPFNHLVPEVCILGRSNVGKSTLLNALGGASAAVARRVHGQGARKAGMAITSATAGCTKLMNAYAFGPPTYGPVLLPPLPTSVANLLPDAAEDGGPSESELARLLEKGGASSPSPTSGRKSRRAGKSRLIKEVMSGSNLGLSAAERRQLIYDAHLQKLYRPPVPKSLIVLDTPGYGLNSQRSWGVELAKYLKRRVMLRGAVVLIDAVAGVKKGDLMALALLRDQNVKTSIVLTKADKVRYMPGAINEVCLSVWEELRKIEEKGQGHGATGWVEGDGWDREIWVTGAGDLKGSENGVDAGNVAGARMAICKMAGLVADDRREGGDMMVIPEAAKPSTGRIITFEEIERMMNEQARATKKGAGGRRARPMASF